MCLFAKTLMLASLFLPGKSGQTPKLYTVKNDLLFHRHWIVVPRNSELQKEIIRSHHDSKLASHPGRTKTLSLH
ncbi:uncharacterized protein VP01_459g6 [Puccinia sorghi]|uniref:Integrase zinc-binding domain-containing protein n=1 Tax=Puccinia sorghi TaxID=27349 RepID=A0A0L6UNJ9_9BASI|nr:uncharacterized protein VP01_459g6 [Puccinia sorghi]